MHCINLRKAFPGCRITFDPAYEDRKDPWMFQIPGKFGTIYPHSETACAVEVDNRRGALSACRELGLVEVQDGDFEHTFLFSQEQFNDVAKIIKPKRKRAWTNEQRQAARERLLARGGIQ